MHALVINPDLESRVRLKQALDFAPEFSIVKMATTLAEALQRLTAGEKYGSLFISSLFGSAVARQFISHAKETIGGRNSAFVLTYSGGVKTTDVAMDLQFGTDGFLVEPFSVEALQKIYRLALKVRRQRAAVRQRESMKLLLQEAADGIDFHAFTLSQFPESPVPRSLDKLRRNLQQIAELAEDAYIDALEEVFSSVTRPRTPCYKGASTRLRKKFGFEGKDKIHPVLARILIQLGRLNP